MSVTSPSTSLSLLERLAGGDGDAWRRLVALYSPLLRAWLRPAGLQTADIDDVTQNALGIVVRRLPDYRHNGRPGAFRAWLRRILRNVVRDFVRAAERRVAGGDELLAQLEDPDSDLNRRWDAEHDRYVLRGLLDLVRDDFSPTTWEAFRRTALEGAAAAAVAGELELSVNAVHAARSRVLARLRAEAKNFL
jgi:RNA polymerase sigma-70 factor (ECF subfamily)